MGIMVVGAEAEEVRGGLGVRLWLVGRCVVVAAEGKVRVWRGGKVGRVCGLYLDHERARMGGLNS